MKTDFNDFSFTVFIGGNLSDFKDIINNIYKDEIKNDKFLIKEDYFSIQDYIDSIPEKSKPRRFSFWKSSQHPSMIFFSSNSSDGCFTLCNVIHDKTGCSYISCSMHNGNGGYMAGYMFHYVDKNNKERHVLAYKNPKWTFYQQGNPMPCEDTTLYDNRTIKKRLNNDIISNYLSKLGIVFEKIDTDVSESFTCILNI